jgi:hypothetical protein
VLLALVCPGTGTCKADKSSWNTLTIHLLKQQTLPARRSLLLKDGGPVQTTAVADDGLLQVAPRKGNDVFFEEQPHALRPAADGRGPSAVEVSQQSLAQFGI